MQGKFLSSDPLLIFSTYGQLRLLLLVSGGCVIGSGCSGLSSEAVELETYNLVEIAAGSG